MSHTIDRLFAVLSFVVVGFGSLACRPLPERLVAPVGSTDTLPALKPLPSLIARPVAVLSRAPFLVKPPGPPARNITPMQVMRAEDLPRLKGKPATRTGSTSTFTAASTPARLPGSGPWMPGTLVIQTERLDLYVGKQTFSSDQVAALAPLIEQLLRDNEARFGTSLKQRVSVAFYRAGIAPSRGVRGMAYTDEQRTEVFYRPNERVDSAATVVAHELAHHLEAQRYGAQVQRRADTILHEGLATWIVSERWLTMCGSVSWKARARSLRSAGVPLRLLTAERSGANNAYEIWASFVDFLIDHYGRDKLDALYRSGHGRAPGAADYRQVLGKSLDELADDWRAWVER